MTRFSVGNGMPPVVKNLLIINGLVYLAQVVFAQQGVELEFWGALWPYQSPYFGVWQLVTHMFMHSRGTIFHIVFNMFGLWMFGSVLEKRWGSKRFLQFYLLCGIIAGIAHLLFSGGYASAVGASGAIMGILAGFAYLFPNNELYLMLIPIPIKAKYAIPALMALDLFGAFSGQSSNIAHWAHLGGALAGLIIVIIWNKTNRKTFY
ncbi:MAG: rhomboid family intramembrane serine protease [Chitinophagaceae bacterium]